MDATISTAPETTAGLVEAASVAVVDPVSTAVTAGLDPAHASAQVSGETVVPTTVTQDAAADATLAPAEAVIPEPLPEPYTSLLKQAKENPTEFNTWTSLISAAEKLADIGRLRVVYDAFLAEYPLCYGYWKKYADAEARFTSLAEATKIFDRGVAAVPYSVDLWGHYAMHKQKAGAPVDEVERLFERGLAYVGMDYLSHGLWDKYLTYELSLGSHLQVAQLYSRLLRMPIQRLDEYRTRFYEYAAQHTTAEIMAQEERSLLITQLARELKEAQAAEAAAAEAAAAQALASAAAAASAAANTDTAQAMDTTAAGDDAFDATAQETVNAAGSMTGNIAAPAAATAADSTAVDDTPVAEAASDMPMVPTPDDVAASMSAAASVSITADPSAAIPTASALDSATPDALAASFPASAPTNASGMLPPQDTVMQDTAAAAAELAAPAVTAQSADTDMTDAVIPQTDGPADDPMGVSINQAAPMGLATAAPDQAAALAPLTTPLPSQAATAPAEVPLVPVLAPAADSVSATLDLAAAAAAGVASQDTSLIAGADASTASASAAPAAALDAPAAAPEAPAAATDALAAAEAAVSAVTPESAVTDDQIKAAWLRSIDETYAVAKEEWQRRKPFEDGIKRPYFHVKPLDLAQLQNWSKYLDYIEEKKDIGMIIRLYERCLVACASYPDMWMRYVRWQEASSKAAAQVALERATSVHCKRRPEIQLFAAHFFERHGNLKTARALFKLVTERLAPTLLQGTVQYANFERRQQSKAAACSVFDKFLDREATKEDSSNYIFMVLQYMHALQWGFSDASQAREVYNAALKRKRDSLALWEGVIHFEESLPSPDRVTRVLDIYKRAVDTSLPAAPAAATSDAVPVAAPAADAATPSGPAAAAVTDAAAADATATTTAEPSAEAAAAIPEPASSLTESERESLSLRAIDFVDLHGDAAMLAQVEQQHAHSFKLPGKVATSAPSRKRSADQMAGTVSKAAKTAAAATPAAAAAYPATPLPGPPAAAASAAMSQGYYAAGAQSYYQYPQAYTGAQQPYAYPAASAAGGTAYPYQAYY